MISVAALTEFMADWIQVEVVAGHAERQVLVALTLPATASVADAVAAANLPERLPELEFEADAVGIFGKRCRPDRILADGDRVEVYQPLKADPKVVRRELAEIEREQKKSSGREPS